MRKILSLLIVVVLLSSCAAYHTGVTTSSTSLTSNNFTFVQRDVQGTATCTYILGIGGLAKDAIAAEAKKNLLKKYSLKANQALANISTDHKRVMPFYILGIIYNKAECTVTADIIEYKN